MLTVLYVTKRGLYPMLNDQLGQYELLASCLIEQTYQDYEVICVDAENNIPRGELTHFLGDRRVKFVRPRQTPLVRLGAFCPESARNTGLVYARGSVIVGLDDCFSFSPTYLEHIAELANDGVYAAAKLFHNDTGVAYPYQPDGPVPESQEIGGIFSYPIDAAVAINGWDERFDGGSGGDIDMTRRLRLHGVRFSHHPGVAVTGHSHGSRTRSHLRCWRLGWDIARKRYPTSILGNQPWSAGELERWDSCGREKDPRVCCLTGLGCDYDSAESTAEADIRRTHEQVEWFNLGRERALYAS
jgi:hypothetical protein